MVLRAATILGVGFAAGLAVCAWCWALGLWPMNRADAQAGAPFQAIAVSAAPAGVNTTQAWFVGKDGTARVCFSTGRSSQCSPVTW